MSRLLWTAIEAPTDRTSRADPPVKPASVITSSNHLLIVTGDMALKGRLDVIQKWVTDGGLSLVSLKDNGNKRSVQRKRLVNTLPILQTDKVEDWAETWILCKGLDPYWRDRPVLLRLPKAQRLAREPVVVQLPVTLHYLHVAEICRPLVTYDSYQKGCLF